MGVREIYKDREKDREKERLLSQRNIRDIAGGHVTFYEKGKKEKKI